jgi:hypothetical protein
MKKYSCNNLKAINKRALKIKYVNSYILYMVLNNLLRYGMNEWIIFYWGLVSPRIKSTPMFDNLV